MKMKPALVIALLVAALLFSAGCGKGNVTPSPSPMMTPVTTSKLTPAMTTSPLPDLSPAGSPGVSPNTSPAVIEGFVEGGEVDPTKVPDIVNAVKAKYADATIEKIVYATYNGEQVYEVDLKGAAAGADKIYVRPDGTIVESPTTTG